MTRDRLALASTEALKARHEALANIYWDARDRGADAADAISNAQDFVGEFSLIDSELDARWEAAR